MTTSNSSVDRIHITDAELVERFKGGDESVFVEIMHRHRARIYTVAENLLHNHADAEEVTQDAFLRAYRNLRGFRGDSSLATWLHHIVFNLARNRYWYFFRRRRHLTFSLDCPIREESDASFADVMAAAAPDPAQEASTKELLMLIAAAMEKLDSSYREILALRNLRNLSYAEIARLLDLNIGTVKSRIARAREHLRARLAKTCPDFAPEAPPSRDCGLLVPEWV